MASPSSPNLYPKFPLSTRAFLYLVPKMPHLAPQVRPYLTSLCLLYPSNHRSPWSPEDLFFLLSGCTELNYVREPAGWAGSATFDQVTYLPKLASELGFSSVKNIFLGALPAIIERLYSPQYREVCTPLPSPI